MGWLGRWRRARILKRHAIPHDAFNAALAALPILHGLDASAWEFVKLAAERAYDTRTGFEDVLELPDGSRAKNNGELVAAACRIVAKVASP